MKICPVGAELFHAGGRSDTQIDITKIIVAFRNFAKAHKKNSSLPSPFQEVLNKTQGRVFVDKQNTGITQLQYVLVTHLYNYVSDAFLR